MSKGLTYFLGILTGVLLTLGFFAVKSYTSKDKTDGGVKTEESAKLPDGVTMLDEPVPFNEAKNFQVLQVVFEDAALAQSEKKMQYTGSTYYTPCYCLHSLTRFEVELRSTNLTLGIAQTRSLVLRLNFVRQTSRSA